MTQDNWSSLLSELGIQQPLSSEQQAESTVPAESIPDKPEGTDHPEPGSSQQPSVLNEAFSDREATLDESDQGHGRPVESAGKKSKNGKSSFFDLLPKIDLFASSTKEKVNLAVTGLADAILPAVRDSVHNTIEALAPQRLEKVDDSPARHRPSKKENVGKSSPATPGDAWSSLASQLGIIAAAAPPVESEPSSREEPIPVSAWSRPDKASRPGKDKTPEGAGPEMSESPKRNRQSRHEEADRRGETGQGRDRDSDRDSARNPERHEVRDRRNERATSRKQGWDADTRREELPVDVSATWDHGVSGKTIDFAADVFEAETPVTSDGRRGRDTRRRGRHQDGRHRAMDASSNEESGPEVDLRAAEALRKSGIDFETPLRESRRSRNWKRDRNGELPISTDPDPTLQETATGDDSMQAERQQGRRKRRVRGTLPDKKNARPADKAEEETYDDSELVQLQRGFPDWAEAVATVVDINLARQVQRQGGRRKR